MDLQRLVYDRRSTTRGDGNTASSTRPGGWTPTNVAALHPELRAGWLCFQQGTERRRFAPIPAGWQSLPDSVLRVMLDVATPVTRPESTPMRERE